MTSAKDLRTGVEFSVWSSAFDVSPLYHIGTSSIQGEGVISDKEIMPNTVLSPLTTPVPIGENPWPYSSGPMMKMNHSKTPNATAYRQDINPASYVIYVKANTYILPGEEITLNYDILNKELGYGKSEPWYK